VRAKGLVECSQPILLMEGGRREGGREGGRERGREGERERGREGERERGREGAGREAMRREGASRADARAKTHTYTHTHTHDRTYVLRAYTPTPTPTLTHTIELRSCAHTQYNHTPPYRAPTHVHPATPPQDRSYPLPTQKEGEKKAHAGRKNQRKKIQNREQTTE
jgi:hypothetical protein